MLKKYKEELIYKKEVYLRVKVRPGASNTRVKAVLEDGTVKIDVAAVPEKGKANQALVNFLASEFAVKKDSVRIISGAGDKLKLIKIAL